MDIKIKVHRAVAVRLCLALALAVGERVCPARVADDRIHNTFIFALRVPLSGLLCL